MKMVIWWEVMQTVPGPEPDIAFKKRTHDRVQFWRGWLIFTDIMCKRLCGTQQS